MSWMNVLVEADRRIMGQEVFKEVEVKESAIKSSKRRLREPSIQDRDVSS